jgi:hypothetical protein
MYLSKVQYLVAVGGSGKPGLEMPLPDLSALIGRLLPNKRTARRCVTSRADWPGLDVGRYFTFIPRDGLSGEAKEVAVRFGQAERYAVCVRPCPVSRDRKTKSGSSAMSRTWLTAASKWSGFCVRRPCPGLIGWAGISLSFRCHRTRWKESARWADLAVGKLA